MPTVAESTPGMVSVSTRRPPGSSVRSTRPPNSSTSRTWVVPGAVVPTGAGVDAAASTPAPVRWSVAVSRLRGGGGLDRGAVTRGGGVTLSDRDQADLAAGVDVGDLHLQLVTDVRDVLDLGDPLAAAELADVHQPVLAREEGDEGPEGGGLDDRAQEPLAHLRHLRVRDRVDPVHRGLGRGAVGRADVDRAVVLDGDVGAGLVLDRVDHL